MERVPSISLYRPRVKKKEGEETGKLVVSQIWWMHWRQGGRDRRNRREPEIDGKRNGDVRFDEWSWSVARSRCKSRGSKPNRSS